MALVRKGVLQVEISASTLHHRQADLNPNAVAVPRKPAFSKESSPEGPITIRSADLRANETQA